MTWPFCFRVNLTSSGVVPCSVPLTLTVAPAGVDVTGILCVFFRTSVAQPGESSMLTSGGMRSRAVFFLHMVPSSSHMNIYPAKEKVVKVMSILEMRPTGRRVAGMIPAAKQEVTLVLAELSRSLHALVYDLKCWRSVLTHSSIFGEISAQSSKLVIEDSPLIQFSADDIVCKYLSMCLGRWVIFGVLTRVRSVADRIGRPVPLRYPNNPV